MHKRETLVIKSKLLVHKQSASKGCDMIASSNSQQAYKNIFSNLLRIVLCLSEKITLENFKQVLKEINTVKKQQITYCTYEKP